MKLTAELIEQAAQYTNAVRDRELDLRGAGMRGEPAPEGGAGPRGGSWARPCGAGFGPKDSFFGSVGADGGFMPCGSGVKAPCRFFFSNPFVQASPPGPVFRRVLLTCGHPLIPASRFSFP